jgi:mannose-6-phosphate isomerase-like protein (cupin superfamily)
MPSYAITQLDQLSPQRCSCGFTRRAFADLPQAVASLHLVEIQADAKAHYHRKTTEIYLIIEGIGEIEVDGIRHSVKPMTAIYIKPGCRHRAIGNMKIINIPVPAFDEEDEWFDPAERADIR